MAEPPFNAKTFSSAIDGSARISRRTCSMYRSCMRRALRHVGGPEVLRHIDPVGRVQLATLDERARTGAEIDCILVQMLQPGVLMPVGKHDKQPSAHDAQAGATKLNQCSGAKVQRTHKKQYKIIK